MARYLVTFTLILIAALARLLPHLPNVAPVTAIALFGAVYLDRKYTFIIPIAAMLLSDWVIGFHSTMAWVYASFVGIGCIGLWLRRHRSAAATAGASIAGSVLFFVVTNFGVWATQMQTYPHTFAGLAACYTAAIPFFRNTLIGDLAWVAVLFGSYALVRRFVPALRTAPAGA